MINNEIKLNKADHYERRNNIRRFHSRSVKAKDLHDKVLPVLEKVKVKNTKSDIVVCHRMGGVRKTNISFGSRKHSFDVLNNKNMIISVDLSSVGLDNSTKLYFTQICLITIIRLLLTVANSERGNS